MTQPNFEWLVIGVTLWKYSIYENVPENWMECETMNTFYPLFNVNVFGSRTAECEWLNNEFQMNHRIETSAVVVNKTCVFSNQRKQTPKVNWENNWHVYTLHTVHW